MSLGVSLNSHIKPAITSFPIPVWPCLSCTSFTDQSLPIYTSPLSVCDFIISLCPCGLQKVFFCQFFKLRFLSSLSNPLFAAFPELQSAFGSHRGLSRWYVVLPHSVIFVHCHIRWITHHSGEPMVDWQFTFTTSLVNVPNLTFLTFTDLLAGTIFKTFQCKRRYDLQFGTLSRFLPSRLFFGSHTSGTPSLLSNVPFRLWI